MAIVAHSFLFLLAFPLIVQGAAIPVKNQKSILNNDGDAILVNGAAALAQPAVQPNGREDIPTMDLPVLSGNASEEKSGADVAQITQFAIALPTNQPSQADITKDRAAAPNTEEDTLIEPPNPGSEELKGDRVNEQATIADHIVSSREEKAVIEDAEDTTTKNQFVTRSPTPSLTLYTTTSYDTPSPSSSPPPYTPGWCTFHVRQVYYTTCLGFNHHDCTRINSTITLYDGAQHLLTSRSVTLTYDGSAEFSFLSSLPYPLTFTQLGIVQGVDQQLSSPNRKNYWPMSMGYDELQWRNDDDGQCRWGDWEGLLDNRDFDCGFSC